MLIEDPELHRQWMGIITERLAPAAFARQVTQHLGVGATWYSLADGWSPEGKVELAPEEAWPDWIERAASADRVIVLGTRDSDAPWMASLIAVGCRVHAQGTAEFYLRRSPRHAEALSRVTWFTKARQVRISGECTGLMPTSMYDWKSCGELLNRLMSAV